MANIVPDTSAVAKGKKSHKKLAKRIGIRTQDGDEMVDFALSIFRAEHSDITATASMRWDAFIWLSDRYFGKAPLVVDISLDETESKLAIDFSKLSDDQLKAYEELESVFTNATKVLDV